MDKSHSLLLEAPRSSRSWSADFSAALPYYELTKPGITAFIGISAAAGLIATQVSASASLLLVTIAATMAMSAGAAAQNQIAERSIDAGMQRTATRPLPAQRITLRQARVFAWSLTLVGLAISLIALPPFATLFLGLSHISYIYLYTPLKRTTPLCTLAGAIPGALPVLAGWTATGAPISITALALTGILFTWQIPHFMAIGWLGRDDYARAGYSMLFVVEPSGRDSAAVSVLYAAAMLGCALVLGQAASLGWLYHTISMVSGGVYTLLAWRFLRMRDRMNARKLFFASLIVLPLLLGVLALDLAHV